MLRRGVPLTRASVTAASRVMLPTYPVLLGFVGGTFILSSAHRIHNSPALRYANSLFPIHYWGWGFVIAAITMVVALVAHSRQIYTTALSVGIVWMILWSGVLLLAAVNREAPWSGFAYPAFVARALWASLVSIKVGET